MCSGGERNRESVFVKKQRISCSIMLREIAFLICGIPMIRAINFELPVDYSTRALVVQKSTEDDTQIKKDFTASKGVHENQENLSGQKLSHLFFV